MDEPGYGEITEILVVSEDTVWRDWRPARIWLLRAMNGEGTHAG